MSDRLDRAIETALTDLKASDELIAAMAERDEKISKLETALTALAAKLDADEGVTDTDYEAGVGSDLA